MKKIIWYTPDLQLFAGDGAEGMNGETGGTDAVAGQNGAAGTIAEDEFNELINGKFKEQFTKKTQAIIDKRFKQTKELEEYKEKVSPTVTRLMEKYGLTDGQEELLPEYVSGEKKRISAGGEFSPAEKIHKHTDALRSRVRGWFEDSSELKNDYPDFDLRKELRSNKLFSQLLMGGAPLRAAYETVHKDEILSGAMAYTADQVRQQVVKDIEAKGRRPVENGVSSESATVTSINVNALTSQDILKILKQVENGASIRF